MKKTLFKLLSGAGLAIALSPSSALAVSLTTISYFETNKEFRWEFEINDLVNDGIFQNLPPGADLWRMAVMEPPVPGPVPLAISAWHNSKAHDIDEPSGEPISGPIFLGSLTAAGGTVFKTSADHLTTGDEIHKDIYQLDYTKVTTVDGSNTTNFVFTGRHVPEPLTMLGSAAALGFGGLFQRHKSKKKNKAV